MKQDCFPSVFSGGAGGASWLRPGWGPRAPGKLHGSPLRLGRGKASHTIIANIFWSSCTPPWKGGPWAPPTACSSEQEQLFLNEPHFPRRPPRKGMSQCSAELSCSFSDKLDFGIFRQGTMESSPTWRRTCSFWAPTAFRLSHRSAHLLRCSQQRHN